MMFLYILFLLTCMLYIFLNPFPPKEKVVVESYHERYRREFLRERKRRALQANASRKETALKKERERVKREAHAERTKRNALRKEEARLEYSLRIWGRIPSQ